jgi:hypothetical protein
VPRNPRRARPIAWLELTYTSHLSTRGHRNVGQIFGLANQPANARMQRWFTGTDECYPVDFARLMTALTGVKARDQRRISSMLHLLFEDPLYGSSSLDGYS